MYLYNKTHSLLTWSVDKLSLSKEKFITKVFSLFLIYIWKKNRDLLNKQQDDLDSRTIPTPQVHSTNIQIITLVKIDFCHFGDLVCNKGIYINVALKNKKI